VSIIIRYAGWFTKSVKERHMPVLKNSGYKIIVKFIIPTPKNETINNIKINRLSNILQDFKLQMACNKL
jgi:hypothetical protein